MISTPIPRPSREADRGSQSIYGAEEKAKPPHLTRAEQDVFEGVERGFTTNHIAKWLGVAESTVKTLLKRIAKKLKPHGDLKGYRLVLWYAGTNKKEEDRAA